MKTTKIPYLLFSLAIVTALVLTAIPMVPAHALSDSAVKQNTAISAATNNSPVLTAGIVVCRTRIVWRHHHRIAVRICHRMSRPGAQ